MHDGWSSQKAYTVVAVLVAVLVAVVACVLVAVDHSVLVAVWVCVDVTVDVPSHVWHMTWHIARIFTARVPRPSQADAPNRSQKAGSTMPGRSQCGFGVTVAVEVAVEVARHGPISVGRQSDGPKQGRPPKTGCTMTR